MRTQEFVHAVAKRDTDAKSKLDDIHVGQTWKAILQQLIEMDCPFSFVESEMRRIEAEELAEVEEKLDAAVDALFGDEGEGE